MYTCMNPIKPNWNCGQILWTKSIKNTVKSNETQKSPEHPIKNIEQKENYIV